MHHLCRLTGVLGLFFLGFVSISGCSEGGGVNIFSLDDDKALGAKIANSIAADPVQFPILDTVAYKRAYEQLYDLRDSILNTGAVVHATDFTWTIYIIHQDTIVNAFCTPGGYIYVYTGLLHFVENEAQLAGVIAHEMAHADLRHSTDQLTKAYGISLLLNLIVGEDGSAIAEIAANLTQLAFSRSDESQADAYAVRYLCGTTFDASGAAGFFEKVQQDSTASIPAFFSTHPNPDDRVTDIRQEASNLNCTGNQTYADDYTRFLRLLPTAKQVP